MGGWVGPKAGPDVLENTRRLWLSIPSNKNQTNNTKRQTRLQFLSPVFTLTTPWELYVRVEAYLHSFLTWTLHVAKWTVISISTVLAPPPSKKKLFQRARSDVF